MGLWQRITRVFRAGTGAALDRIENPELVLQQTIRDMRDRVPELNNSVAQVMATERLLIKNHENLEKQVVDLVQLGLQVLVGLLAARIVLRKARNGSQSNAGDRQ